MTDARIVQRRLRTQGLMRPEYRTPVDVVRWLTAVQSQDYAGAKWAIGLRTVGLTDAAVDRAFDAGEILRTHVLRPTWHFVAPDDIRWLQTLTAPRVQTFCGSYYRKLEMDEKTLATSRRVFERALRDGRYRTRTELQAKLKTAGIAAAGMRLAFFMMHAELEQLICSGPRRGKQFTYALIDERAPNARLLSVDEALAELTRRYFTSHGPATPRDFSWWSGLTMAQVKRGMAIVGNALRKETADGHTYWAVEPRRPMPASAARAYLLPNYDECLIAYRDRGPITSGGPSASRTDAFAYHVLADERIAGSWRRTVTRSSATIEIATYEKPQPPIADALSAAATRFGAFVERPVTTSFNRLRR